MREEASSKNGRGEKTKKRLETRGVKKRYDIKRSRKRGREKSTNYKWSCPRNGFTICKFKTKNPSPSKTLNHILTMFLM